MEQVTVKLTPSNSSNPIINEITTDTTLILNDVAHDTYTLDITSDVYKPYNTTIVVDDETTLDIHLEALVTQQIEWRPKSKVTTIPITTDYTNDPTLGLGVEVVDSEGTEGKTTTTWEEEYIDGVATGRKRNEKTTTTVQMVQRQVRRGTLAVINIAERGAVYNNPTHDNKPLLHEVMDELHANGGGTIEFPSNGDLYVSENIMVRENIILQGIGDKPTIKLMPNVSDFWTMLHLETKQNIKIDNLTLDSNKAGRTNNLGDLSVLPQIIIAMSNESADIDITNSKIVGNGVWLVACHTGGIHPKNIKVNNNELFWSMGYSTPDKEFVNGVTVDNTWVYFDAIGYEFIGNTLNSDTPIANMTAIEAHGANGVVRDNTVRNARTGIIPWNMVNNEMSIANNILVEDNEFIDVLNGVDVGLSPTRNFKKLIIRRNSFHLKPSNFTGAVFSRGIILGVWNATNGEISEDFEIYENTITSEDYQLPHADSGAYHNYYGIGIGSGVYKNLTIRDNVINGVPSFGIMLQNESFKNIDIQSGTIIGNTIKNSAKSLSNRGSFIISAIHVSSRVDTNTNGLTVDINDIIDERSTTETWYTQPTNMPVAPRFKEQNITESKLPPQGVVVYDSRDYSIDFTRNETNIYMDSLEVVVAPNNQYVLETDFPGDLWVSNNKNIPLQSKVSNNQSESIMIDSGGRFVISTRPPVDLEGTTYSHNSSHFENKTYYFTIKRIGDEAPLEGLIVSGIGDSIMYGRSDTSENRITNPWIAQVGQLLDAVQTNNFGISRSTQTRGDDPNYYGTDSQRNPMVSRYQQIPLDSDIIIIQGGVNDLVSNIPLGVMSDRTEGTYYGGLHILYGGIKSRYPDARIIVINMFQSSNVAYHPSGVTKANWANAQVQVALHYNLEVLDVFNNSTLTPDTLDMEDGIHFSQNDADIFAQELYRFINGIDNGVEVYNSKNGIDFNQTTVMGYMRTATITLEANRTYKVSTNLPREHNTGTLSISNDLSTPTQIILSPGVESTVTLGSSGQLFISGRPTTDPDGASWVYNINKIISGEYEISVTEG